MQTKESDFSSLLQSIRCERDTYSSILKLNHTKAQLIVDVHSNPDRLPQLIVLIQSEINLIDILLNGSAVEADFVKRILEKCGLSGSNMEEGSLMLNASRDILNISQLLESLKKLLLSELNASTPQLKTCLDEEIKIHMRIRRAFFYFLRLLIDYLKNLEQKKPLIAVIVPAHNEEGYIQSCIRAVRNQTYPNKRLIVVDSVSTDRTMEKVEPYTFDHVRVSKKGVGVARNEGGRKAIAMGAEILVFLDADSIMRSDLLEKVWEAVFWENKVAGICKTQLDKTHWRAKVFNFLHHLNRIVWKVPHTFMFSTREVFIQVPFREDVSLGEDVDWAHNVIRNAGIGKFKVITNSWLTTSSRRLEKYGYFKTIWRWAETWPFGLITGKKDENYFD